MKPLTRCLACSARTRLLDLDWILCVETTAANVHRVANIRTPIMYALELIRVGAGDCQKCQLALDNARDKMETTS